MQLRVRCPPGDLEQLDRLGRPSGVYGRPGERSEPCFEPHAECAHGLDNGPASQAICKWSFPVRPVRDIWWSWLRGLGSHRARVGYRLGGMGCAVHV